MGIREDLADSLLPLCVCPLEGNQDRQRYLSLSQVSARFFPGMSPAGGIVLDVVQKLKGEPEVESEGVEGTDLGGSPRARTPPRVQDIAKREAVFFFVICILDRSLRERFPWFCSSSIWPSTS